MNTISDKTWVVHHLLGADETSCWFGPPGSGKSALGEDIGLHVAAQPRWHGRVVKQGAVLYVALERAAVVARRALAFAAEHEFTGSKLPFALVRGPLDFRDPETATKIVVTMRDLAKRYGVEPQLIQIDTVNRALNGGDENSPRDMGSLIATLSLIQAALPTVHIMLIHHTPADGQERMRGHSALLGALDVAVHVSKTTGGARVAELVKASDFDDEQSIVFSLKSVTIGQNEHGEPVTAPVVVPADGTSEPKAKKQRQLPKTAIIAIKALDYALVEGGEMPPASNHIPAHTPIVTVDQWRKYSYLRGISTGGDRAQQKAFKAAFETLIAAELVGHWNGQVWKVS
jgi:AAA domain